MNQTHLSLLTRDGAVDVCFEPELEPEQYTRLHEIVGKADTEIELRLLVEALAAEWDRKVYFA
jgi:hypothetical protein